MTDVTVFWKSIPGAIVFPRSDEMLRLAASLFAGIPAEELETVREPGKKPFFRDHPEIFSSVSHSGGVWACALARNGPVGLDIQVRTVPRARERIMDKYFRPEERAYVRACADPDGAFSRLWCRKEAAVKMSGRGIDALFADYSAVTEGESPIDAFPSPPMTLRDTPDGTLFLTEFALPAFPNLFASLVLPRPFSLRTLPLPETHSDQGAPHAVQFD